MKQKVKIFLSKTWWSIVVFSFSVTAVGYFLSMGNGDVAFLAGVVAAGYLGHITGTASVVFSKNSPFQ